MHGYLWAFKISQNIAPKRSINNIPALADNGWPGEAIFWANYG